MRSKTLRLSHWNDPTPIFVSEKVTKELTPYQICGVRFLYSNFQQKKGGAILNHEPGMNFKIQVAAFFNALNSKINRCYPVLIICEPDAVNEWRYHLKTHANLDTRLLNTLNPNLLSFDSGAIIATISDDSRKLLDIKNNKFFCVVIEELHRVVTKLAVRSLKGDFNIGLSTQNFLKHPDQKAFWNMLKWINAKEVGTFKEFSVEDDDYLANCQNPYDPWWQRLTWEYCESFKPKSSAEKREYQNILQRWYKNNITSVNLQTSKSQNTKKRKSKPILHTKDEEVNQSEIPEPNSFSETPTLVNLKEDTSSSQDTIIYDFKEEDILKINQVPDLTSSSKRNQESDSSPVLKHLNDDALSMLFGNSETSQQTATIDNEDNLSIIDGTPKKKKRRFSDKITCDTQILKSQSKSSDDVLSMLFG